MRRETGLYEQFKGQEIFRKILPGKIVVAVSGGADSVTLLHLLRRLSGERGWEIVVAHIQHHLRGRASLRDQKFVESLCKEYDLPCVVRSINLFENSVPGAHGQRFKLKPSGIEETARSLRYHALAKIAEEYNAATLFTAHTANDQTETFFLSLLRGTGMDGLSGIEPLKPLSEVTGDQDHASIRLARPLLFFSWEDVQRYLAAQQLKYCVDSSNRLLKYRRNWIRHRVIPLIEQVQPRIVQRISDLTKILQREEKWRKVQIEKMTKDVLVPASGPVAGGHSRIRSKIAKQFSEAKFVSSGMLAGSSLELCSHECGSRKLTPLGKQIFGNVQPAAELDLIRFFRYDINLRYQWLHRFMPECSYRRIEQVYTFLERERLRGKRLLPVERLFFPPFRNDSSSRKRKDFFLKAPGTTILPDWKMQVSIRFFNRSVRQNGFKKALSSSKVACFDADQLMTGQRHLKWKIRSWRAGDRFMPFGMNGREKKIQDFFVDKKISRESRPLVPLLLVGDKIRWIVGHRTDEESKIKLTTKHVAVVQVSNLQ